MEYASRDILLNSFGVSDLEGLKQRLRCMPENEILLELDRITEEARQKGEELDPHITLIYYEVMDELHPISIPKNAKTKAKERFAKDYPEYMMPLSGGNHPAKVKNVSFHLHTRRAVIIAALVAVFTLGSVAVAFDLPHRLIVWGEETFHINAGRGSDMRLESPTGEGFYTLEDALSFHNVSTCTPQWLPARFKLESVAVNEAEYWTSFIAVFNSIDESTDSCVIKIMKYKDPTLSPDLTYEDNGAGNRETKIVGDLTLQITENNNLYRISWESGNCLGSIVGIFSEDEVNEIIEHIE